MKLPFTRGLAVLALAVAGGLASFVSLGNPASAQNLAIPLVRLDSGATANDIKATVDQFRADLGGVNNGAGGSFATGRREINWDGVPDNFSSPNAFPPDFFNKNSPRGSVYSTPGTGFENSAKAGNPTNTPVRFGNIDPSYTNTFSAFSPERIFTAVGSNIMDVHFFIPGTSTPATVTGFGAVFTDVDFVGSSIQYFDRHGRSLGTWIVPPGPSRGFSFLGVTFVNPLGGQVDGVARVRITSGNAALKAGFVDSPPFIDVVALDDFIYGEPRQ